MSVDKSLPPELVDRINTSKRRCFSGSGIIPKTEKAYTPASVHTGGWMPYTSITRNGGARMSSESRLVSRAAALTNNPSVMHTSETAHWLNRNAVGSPEKTAWTINEKGNRVWFSYEHTPTLFPVTETRFYKPKLHKMDFLGIKKKEEDGRHI